MTSLEIPNISGSAMTVLGPVAPDDLGVTLTHEHIFIDLRKSHQPYRKYIVVDGKLIVDVPEDDFPATELHMWEAKLDLSNMSAARNVAPISDNYFLDDEELAIQEVSEYRRCGGNTICEMTSIGIKRDPEALRRVSERTGVHIVTGTGYYQRVYHPDDMDRRTVEQLTDTIVNDVVVGWRETGIRSGVVGEIGINGDPLTDNELKSMRAAARAARLTGAPVCIHLGGVGAEKHRVLDIAREEGVALERVVMGHCDDLVYEVGLLYELLDRGVYVAFDNLGRELEVVTQSRTSLIAQAIPGIVEKGYLDRILISQDVCYKMSLKAYGGFGYTFLLQQFIPGLKALGVTGSQIDTMMIDNAKRILAFVPPQP